MLVVQIAVCAVLITSSPVAVRGLVRSLHGDFGFDPNHSFLVDLRAGSYSADRVSATQRKMIDAVDSIAGVESAGMTDALLLSDANPTNVFSDATTDLRVSQVAATPYTFHVSPAYLHTEGTVLVAGRSLTWNDNQNSPRVAVVNRELARQLFHSDTGALGRHFKAGDGTRVEVVAIAEDGKYGTLTEDPHPAMFLPLLQWPASGQWMVVRSSRDPRQLGAEIRGALHHVDAGLPVEIEKRYDEVVSVLFGPKMATIALGVLGGMGAILSITGIFGLAAYTVSKRLRELGIRVALGASRRQVLKAALDRALRLLAYGSAAGFVLCLLATWILALVVYQATPRDPVVLLGAVVAMALVGLAAASIPARRALSIDPVILLRED